MSPDISPQDALDRGLKLPFDRLYMRLPGVVDEEVVQMAASLAAEYAAKRAPRLSGASASNLMPIWGEDYFGVRWVERYVWFQEMGIRPFVMNNLQGKTIPMWVEDPDGELRRKNRRIKSRRTEDGRLQVLIFRHASKKGERKLVKRKVQGVEQWVDVPRSYPGAPGRINKRRLGAPFTRGGGGQIMRGNVGVRWRHPGLASRFFIHESILLAGREMGLPVGPIGVGVEGVAI